MEQRIISFSMDEIAVDTDDVVNSINEACTKRHHHYWVRGVCQVEQQVYFILLPITEGHESEVYRLESLPEEEFGHEDFVSDLNERYQGGFDTVGSFKIYDTIMVVFAKPATA